MEELKFLVQGSSPEPYKVTFTRDGQNINAFCTCPAGSNGKNCKHRFNIMAGNSSGVVSDSSQSLSRVKEWIQGSDIEAALSELAEAEHEYDRAKARVKKAKTGIAKALRS